MRVKKNVSKNSVSYSVIESYRDINGKSTTRVVESLGNEENIRKTHPGVDPYEWAKEYAKHLTEEKKAKNKKRLIAFQPSKRISKNEQRSFNVGYVFLQQIYHELKLDKVCSKISKKRAFSFDLNMILSRLIYMRILHPCSKKATFEQAHELLEPHDVKPQHVYRALDVLAEESDMIEAEIYKNSKKIVERDDTILYYDCTNFYFESETADGMKQYGKSKENRPNPIVQMGLFMDGSGLPLAYSLFDGHKNQQPTLRPLEKRILKDFELSQFVICTDAGLASKKNKMFNSMGKRNYITTQSIKKFKHPLQQWALKSNGWKRYDKPHSRKTYTIEEIIDSGDKTTFYKECQTNEMGIEERLIVTFSLKYKLYQEAIRKRQIERAIKKADNPSTLKKKGPNDPARFLQTTYATSDGEVAENRFVTIDEEKIKEEARFDGFYCVSTNLAKSAQNIVEINHQRWEIEESFRIMKSELEARPVYVRKDTRIKAHFLTCFLSLLIFRILEKKSGEKYSCHKLIDTIRNMNCLELANEGYTPAYTRTAVTDKLHDTFGFYTDTEISDYKKFKEIIKNTKKPK